MKDSAVFLSTQVLLADCGETLREGALDALAKLATVHQLFIFGDNVAQFCQKLAVSQLPFQTLKTAPQQTDFAAEITQIDAIIPERSFVITDCPETIQTFHQLGIFGLYLLTAQGSRHLIELPISQTAFHRLENAVEWILTHPDREVAIQRQIEEAATMIRDGHVAAFPTETVYGLGADVFQPEAIAQIFSVKGRPHYNPLIAHIATMEQWADLVPEVPALAQKLAAAFWPGPLTIVLPKRPEVPDIVTGGKNTVAVRMPAHPIALELIKRCQTAVAAPSANKFTYTSPTTATHVKEQLGAGCPVVIDGGACRVGVESTVISVTDTTVTLLRPGGVPAEDLEMVVGKVEMATAEKKQEDAQSPGMMLNHYAPATPLSAFKSIPLEFENRENIGVILFQPSQRSFKGTVDILSPNGDTKEAAANFFAAIRRMDALGLEAIVMEYAPEHGLGLAINNRLEKAAMGRIHL